MKRCTNCFDVHDGMFAACPHCGYVEGDAAQELYHLYPGITLNNRYVVGQVLGYGGFGITYKVWDTNLDTVLAIKEYFPSGLVNRTPGDKDVNIFSGNRRMVYVHGLGRFLDEARSMAKFNSHKNIINVFEYFEQNNTAYIVMEFLDGTTLSEYLKNNRMRHTTAAGIINKICTALKDVHQMGIVHRDVSPDNIFLCTDGTVKLIDFGAARFSSDKEEQRTIILKPGFAPPEQYEKVNIQGPWTDIYALGATLYYMLIGEKPEESTNRKIEDTLFAPHEIDDAIPEYISNTVMQAMAIDRHMRFASVSDFEKALNKEKKVLPVAKQIKRRKRRRFLGVAVALLVIALSSSVFYVNWNRQREEETLPDASISIAFALTGDAAIDNAKESALSTVIDAFVESFPNVSINIITNPILTYEYAILELIAAGNTPALFESSGLSPNNLEYALDLSRVVNRLPKDELHFLNRWEVYFPAANQLPIGFRAPVVYLNTTLSDFEGTSANDMDTFLQQLIREGIPAENALVICGIDDNARESFLAEMAVAYLSDTSAFFEVQRTLPARYRLLYIDTDSPVAEFSNLWSINRNADSNERIVAERFLMYLLSDNAQDILHIRNGSGNLPINKRVLELYGEVYREFYGFFANIESYVFE